MSEQQNGDWYCRQCGYLPGSRVTYSETCDTCHQPVEFHTVAEMSEIESLRQQLAGHLERHHQDSAELRRLCAARDEQRDGRLAQAERAAAAESRIAELEQQLAEARAGRVPEAVVALAPSRAGRVYLAGPMTGIEDYNFPAFNAAADTLRGNGHHVENPADHGIVDGAEWPDYLRYDIARLATCETLALLPGWSQSKGARMERHIADALGMSVIYLNDAEQQPPAGGVGLDEPPSWRDKEAPLGQRLDDLACEMGYEANQTMDQEVADRAALIDEAARALAAQPQQEVGSHD